MCVCERGDDEAGSADITLTRLILRIFCSEFATAIVVESIPAASPLVEGSERKIPAFLDGDEQRRQKSAGQSQFHTRFERLFR